MEEGDSESETEPPQADPSEESELTKLVDDESGNTLVKKGAYRSDQKAVSRFYSRFHPARNVFY